MKKVFTFLAAVLLTATGWAQSPEKMSYQAVIRDASDNLITDTQVGMQVSILQGTADGAAVYVETQEPTTNANGLVSIEIGSSDATVVSGDFTTIDWSTGIYFIKTETDLNGGSSYTITGTSQLLSVPYALHAKTAETVSGGITETDPVFTAWDKSTGISITESQVSDLGNYIETETDPVYAGSVASDITAGDTTYWNEAYGWGNHAEAEYITEEADPMFASSIASGIIQGDVESWDAKSEFDGDFDNLTNVPAFVPAGVINQFAGSAAPEGYLICDGSEVSRTEYADLFATIGTIYGEGDGSTTFNLPNLQTRVPVGLSTDLGFDQLGKTGGAKDHALTVDEMPAHNHGGSTSSSGSHTHSTYLSQAGDHTHTGTTSWSGTSGSMSVKQGIGSGVTVARASGAHRHTFSTNTAGGHSHSVGLMQSGSHSHAVSINSTGGSNAHNNLQPYIVLNYIIKY